jgi:hypothetical protein
LQRDGQIDIGQKTAKRAYQPSVEYGFEENIRHPDVREIDGESLCYLAITQIIIHAISCF